MAMHRIRGSCPIDSDPVRALHHIVEGMKKAVHDALHDPL